MTAALLVSVLLAALVTGCCWWLTRELRELAAAVRELAEETRAEDQRQIRAVLDTLYLPPDGPPRPPVRLLRRRTLEPCTCGECDACRGGGAA